MALTPERLYRVHVENLRAVQAGVQQIERELRAAISRQDAAAAEALLKILLLLIGSWAECRLRKLLYEINGFSADQRVYITSGGSQHESWQRAVELGFRVRHGVPKADLRGAIPPSARMLYVELTETIEKDLRPVIEMRNTLAHGQWARPLNNDGTDVVASMVNALRKENALSARFKMSILEHLAKIIHDLVAGNHAFERDFDAHYGRLETARRNLGTRAYADWEASMIAKYQRGRTKRDAALARKDETHSAGFLSRLFRKIKGDRGIFSRGEGP
ncbi:MAG TPA: hypothetical protein VE891_15945 [Allosphingosinicella sp.]|nr:hypothetical protein [Allosphingosinicella sp.]